MFKASDESLVGGIKFRTIGTLNFRMHNSDYKIPIDTLMDILHLPNDGECNFPKYFMLKKIEPKLLERLLILRIVQKPLAFRTPI